MQTVFFSDKTATAKSESESLFSYHESFKQLLATDKVTNKRSLFTGRQFHSLTAVKFSASSLTLCMCHKFYTVHAGRLL